MNPIHFDFTLIFQVLSFSLILVLVGLVLYFFIFLKRKRRKEKEISEKLDRIIELLERKK